MELVCAAPPVVSVPVFGSSRRFPVHRIYCVGRNYAAHAREMGANPEREEPFFFAKPADAVVTDGATFPYPPRTQELHHEVELVVALGQGGVDATPTDAARWVLGYAAGLDLTRRDLQNVAKASGKPWDMAKGFDASAPIGPLHLASETGVLERGTIRLSVNGDERQHGDLADMIWSVPELIARLSTYVTLRPGDLVFTGTPEGVGPIRRGDELVASIAGLGEHRWRCGSRSGA